MKCASKELENWLKNNKPKIAKPGESGIKTKWKFVPETRSKKKKK